MKIKHILAFFSLAVLLISCDKSMPAGFWTDFHKDFILINNSDQGPWGGHREINWKREVKNTFTNQEIIDFAGKNDWKLLDTITLYKDTLSNTSFSKLKNDDYSFDLLDKNVLPKLNLNDNRIFIFTTTWLAVESGNSRETFANGFAVLNSDGTELKIFHLWGESEQIKNSAK